MADETRKRTHLTQAAEPPMWMIEPPGEGGLEMPLEPPGAEAPPMLFDHLDRDPAGEG